MRDSIFMNNNNSFWESSKGDGTLALRAKALLLGIVPIVLALSPLMGLQIAENELVNSIEAITAILAAGMFLWGLVRNIWYRNQKLGRFAE